MTRTNKGSAEALPLSCFDALLLALDAELAEHPQRDGQARENHEHRDREGQDRSNGVGCSRTDTTEKRAPVRGNHGQKSGENMHFVSFLDC